jgi:peptidyl-prolyl cis-trans isomerase SurA
MGVAIRRSAGDGSPAAAWFALLALGAAALPAALVPGRASGAEPEIVARVNGEPVPRAELDRAIGNPLTLGQARQELGVEHPGRRDLERLALRNVVHRRLAIQEARRRKIQITDKELDTEIASLRRRFDDLRSFGAWMKEQGLDDASLFETVRGDMAADRVRAALVEGVRVSDEDVRSYYAAHGDEFGRAEVRLQVIAVGDEGAAKEIVAALRRGEDFGRIARQRSRGLRAAQGGDTGWVAASLLPSPLREAVAVLNPGEARGPLRRGTDFLVVRLNDRRRGGATRLAEARPEIERRVLAERRKAAIEAWLTEQEMTSKIEILHEAASAPGPNGEAAAAAGSLGR